MDKNKIILHKSEKIRLQGAHCDMIESKCIFKFEKIIKN